MKKNKTNCNCEYLICEKKAEFGSYEEIHAGCTLLTDPRVYEEEILYRTPDKNEVMKKLAESPSMINSSAASFTVTERIALEIKNVRTRKHTNVTILGFSRMPSEKIRNL